MKQEGQSSWQEKVMRYLIVARAFLEVGIWKFYNGSTIACPPHLNGRTGTEINIRDKLGGFVFPRECLVTHVLFLFPGESWGHAGSPSR